MSKTLKTLTSLVLASALFVACGDDRGSGGLNSASTGGLTAITSGDGGTAAASGGGMSFATGGTPSTGGTSIPGTTPTGGISGTGGAPSVGGTPSTGGAPSTGGTPSAGGAPSTGGSSNLPCIVRVKLGGDDTLDGASWQRALATVQAALNKAAARGAAENASCDVWVAGGVYYPTAEPTGAVAPADPRTKTILLRGGVALYGGFAGTENSREQRDYIGRTTTLSGDLGALNDTSDNAYHVITGADNATLDGFTVTLGNASGSDYPLSSGGGMYNASASPTIADHFAADLPVVKGANPPAQSFPIA